MKAAKSAVPRMTAINSGPCPWRYCCRNTKNAMYAKHAANTASQSFYVASIHLLSNALLTGARRRCARPVERIVGPYGA